MESHWYVFIVLCLCFVLIILVTVLAYYYRKVHLCYTYPNIWCYKDWACPYSVQCPGNTGATSCWPGVEALYAPILNQCRYPEQGLPANCTCTFQDTAAAPVCQL